MIHPLLTEGRFLFVIDECSRCAIWKEFVEYTNSEVNPGKEVIIKDCTAYHDYGIVEDPIILLFKPYIKGEYPVLFFEGCRKDGTNTRIEAEAWLNTKLHNDFITKKNNEWLPHIRQYAMFDKECKFGKRGILKNKIICE